MKMRPGVQPPGRCCLGWAIPEIIATPFREQKKKHLHPLLCFSAAAAIATLAAQSVTQVSPEERFKLGTGFDYSRGDYGFTTNTEVFSVPLYFTAETDDWLVRLTLPYLSVKGPASVVGDVGGGAAATARPTNKYESGLGDVMLSLTYHAVRTTDGFTLDLTGRVKFPTADEDRGLGTGKTDYYVQTDLYKTFGSVTPFATIGYRFLGSDAKYPLKDGVYASLGTSYHVTTTTAVGAAFDWRERLVRGVDDATDDHGVLFPTIRMSGGTLLGYVLGGLNNASPDVGVGGMITYRF